VTIGLASGNTIRVGNGNNDTVSILGGSNTAKIGNGVGDVVNDSGGSNTITVGNGNGDVVNHFGGGGDTIKVGNGDDTIYVGSGDTVTVGNGHDSFVFKQTTPGSIGAVTIIGFDPSKDVISLQLTTSVTYKDNAQGNAVVTVDNFGDTITLVGVHASALHPGDFNPPVGDIYTYIPFNDPSSAYFTQALGINNLGQIVGRYVNPAGVGSAYGDAFLDSGGTFTKIAVPGATIGTTEALGINDTGQIVGDYVSGPLSGPAIGFLYSGGQFTNIEFPGAISTGATGINNAGQIVGSFSDTNNIAHGFLYSAGIYTQIDAPGGHDTTVSGINNEGQVTGTYFAPNGTTGGFTAYGFIYNLNTGTYATLGDPLATGGTFSIGINDAGQVVGYFIGQGDQAFLYSNGIYTLLSPSPSNANIATGINDAGEIIGYYPTPNPVPWAYTSFIAVPNSTLVSDATVDAAGTITLVGVHASALHPSDFNFV
jgi:probable HAF family extracellular repeat protein